ncbi:hypothetical protein RQP46_008368 [Phenoliferia psychrophenolica]
MHQTQDQMRQSHALQRLCQTRQGFVMSPKRSRPLLALVRGTRLATSTDLEAIRGAVTAIRTRLFHLESVLANFVPSGQLGPDGGPMYSYPAATESGPQMKVEGEAGGETSAASTGLGMAFHPSASASSYAPAIERIREEGNLAESDGEVEAAVTLEFLALGRDRKQDHFNRSALRRPEEDDVQPTPATPFTASSGLFPSPGALSMDPSHTISPFEVSQLLGEVLPDREQSEAIVRYSLDRVGWQHCAVHGPSFVAECQEFFSWGERRGAMVNMCWLGLYYAILQHLNLHRFESDADWAERRRQQGIDPYSPSGIKALIDREVRKRLWCALATEDWVSIPYRRSYAIFPSHFTTPLPTNCHDEDLACGNLVIRRFFEDVNSLGGLSYDLCLQIDRDIREIISTCPVYLSPDADVRHLPAFVSSFRNYWIMSVHHKLLVIHRTFLGRSFRDPRYSYSRKAAIEAARIIIKRFLLGSNLPQHVWTAIYHAISASTILILDVFQSSATDPADDIASKRFEVTSALDALRRLEDSSPIAARGAQLLGTLLAEEAKHRRPGGAGGGEGSRKRKVDIDLPGGRFGEVAKRVVTTGTSAPSPSSSASLHLIGGEALSPQSLSVSTAYPYFAATAQDSPGNASDGSLTQESFDSILWNGLGAQIGDNSIDFWRLLDQSMEPAVEGGGGLDTGSPFTQWQS